MNEGYINEKLKDINTENYIWIIYIGIIFASWYANSLEKKYYVYKDKKSKEKYQHVMVIIFSVLFIIYFYFFKDSYNDFINLNPNDSNKRKKLITFSFIASTLILISGLIFLYIAIKDDDLDVELAFN